MAAAGSFLGASDFGAADGAPKAQVEESGSASPCGFESGFGFEPDDWSDFAGAENELFAALRSADLSPPVDEAGSDFAVDAAGLSALPEPVPSSPASEPQLSPPEFDGFGFGFDDEPEPRRAGGVDEDLGSLLFG